MALTIQAKHHLHSQLELIMDTEAAATMMEAIPPFDWSEVALKKDIDASFVLSRSETEKAIYKALHDQTTRMVTWMIAMFTASIAANVAAQYFFR